jgi:hypothetical protein
MVERRGEKIMRRELPNVYWRLSASIEGMACGTEPILRRLESAVANIAVFQKSEFPAGEQRDLFTKIMSAATHVQPTGDEGSIEATTSRMSDEEARAVAKDMVKLLGLIVHA